MNNLLKYYWTIYLGWYFPDIIGITREVQALFFPLIVIVILKLRSHCLHLDTKSLPFIAVIFIYITSIKCHNQHMYIVHIIECLCLSRDNPISDTHPLFLILPSLNNATPCLNHLLKFWYSSLLKHNTLLLGIHSTYDDHIGFLIHTRI